MQMMASSTTTVIFAQKIIHFILDAKVLSEPFFKFSSFTNEIKSSLHNSVK